MPSVFLVAANTIREKQLNIDLELRDVIDCLQKGAWDHHYAPASRLTDLINGIRTYDPEIVHFSGHGSPMERLVLFEGDKAKEVSRATFENLFATLHGKIRVVLLSACYSQTQAEMISKHVDCVIGVSSTLEDSSAAKYAEQFYRALVARRSVKRAHEEAGILLTDVDAIHKPVLFTKPGVDPDAVLFTEGRTIKRTRTKAKVTASTDTSQKQSDFKKAAKRFGFSADALSVMKVLDVDGTSVARYTISNLRVSSGEITELCWRSKSAAGLVNAPALEAGASDEGVEWETAKDPTPQSFEDVLRNLGSLRGKFLFEPPIRPGKPRSFSWTVSTLNGDALTAWEFESMYSPQQRTHVTGRTLGSKPIEFCAQLVWFPVQRLSIEVRLPPSQTASPQLRYFELKGALPVPVDQVCREGSIWSYPEEGRDWTRDHAYWERKLDGSQSQVVVTDPAKPADFQIEYPTIGSYYSVDWVLPDPPLGVENERLRNETEEIRNGLLKHKAIQAQLDNETDGQISKLFTSMHEKAREMIGANDPTFSTALMTWDRTSRRVVTIEVCRNAPSKKPVVSEFWLPFGLGLAGVCFRTAPVAIRYKRDLDRVDPARPEMYLPVPGEPQHNYLLSFSIDHPDWSDEAKDEPNSQRCRQMVGVLSLGSCSSASKLGPYCGEKLAPDAMWKLRDACQESMNAISRLLLREAGVLDISATDNAAVSAPGFSSRDGLIREPAVDWSPPQPRELGVFRVAAFDLDGTLIRGDSFQFSWETIWERLGFKKELQNDLKRKYRLQAGPNASQEKRLKAYATWCEAAVEKFCSLHVTRKRLHDMTKSLSLTNNCREALQELRDAGVVTALISGGVNTFLEDLFPDYADYFDFVFINELLFSEDDQLNGVRSTAFDFEGKADALRYIAQRTGVPPEETVFVGDHFNDERAMLLVGKAIAYPPADAATEGVSHVKIFENNLLKVLPHMLLRDSKKQDS